MACDRYVTEDMWQRIGAALDAVEREHGVRVLLAVESGSRAWRFPSTDSDYDVRFIYARRRESYLSIENVRDVIEQPIDGALDISGWDVRKALQLMVRSNATLMEWLSSPVRYRAADEAAARLLKFASHSCHLRALAYHYDRLARRSFTEIESSDGEVSLKTYCYAIRPALALLWMRRHGRPPPMDLPSLERGVATADVVRRAIADLVERKAAATEQDTTARIPVIDAFLAGVLIEWVDRPDLPDRSAVVAQANALFAAVALGEASTAAGRCPSG